MRRTTLPFACAIFTFATAALVDATVTPGQAAAQAVPDQQVRTMRIRVSVEGTAISGTLENNASARDFASLLPLTLRDYANTEKISDLPRRLSMEGAQAGFSTSVRGITYYAP
jgi:hypothetical protein